MLRVTKKDFFSISKYQFQLVFQNLDLIKTIVLKKLGELLENVSCSQAANLFVSNCLSSGQTLGVKAQRFRGHTSPHRNVKGDQKRFFFEGSETTEVPRRNDSISFL
eukprot:TRINITY_DN3312_c0_g1_i1.p2 TRINITY_DN3312_c0_g1~~TRINITY_DN3312_c0_g1_i1.p2  ORF type:complete len:107 (+),score=14.55 TRINITY_DN3312_c0_g1_i1:86-406(+)